jgi:hypothetical protein
MLIDERVTGNTPTYGQLLQAHVAALTLDGSVRDAAGAERAARAAPVALLRRALGARRASPGGRKGGDLLSRLAFAEALGRCAPLSSALAVLAHLDLMSPRLQRGASEAALPFAALAASGEGLLACSLPPAWLVRGRSPSVQARAAQGGYLLNGIERGVRFADGCQHLLVDGAVDPSGDAASAHFLVRGGVKGLSLAESPDGLDAVADVRFADVFVEASMRINGADAPEARFAEARDWAVQLCALCNGAALAMLDELWRHARERGTRKVALADEPRVRAELAWLHCRIERSRALSLAVDDGEPNGEAASGLIAAAILVSRRAARDVGSFATRLQGARSYAGPLHGARFHLESAMGPLWSAPDDVLLAAAAQCSSQWMLGRGLTP